MDDLAPLPHKTNDRADALAVLTRLREAGHVAYFAGGCVRDLLLGREPKDYDVATDAPPGRVRALFSHTQAVGAAFGVILVRHRKSQVEVATFRADGRYVDGRHPEGVTFTTAEEDAKRRDFTINGLFLDPVADQVIDFVGGQADLAARVIRAIGVAERRFEEDHLRLLRAVRFAARFGFAIEPGTARAIRDHAPQLTRISPERVADELRAMLPPPTRVAAWRMLNELDLARVVFRFVDVPPGDPDDDRPADGFFHRLAPDEPVAFPLAMAAAAAQWLWWASPATADARRVFDRPVAAKLVGALRRSLRMSNEECESIEGTYTGLAPLLADAPPGVAAMKRFLARPTAAQSRQLMAAMAAGGVLDAARTSELERELAALERTEFAPAPLITGDDLAAAGAKPGPAFKRMLDAAYDAQLEGRAMTRDEAMVIALAAGRAEPSGRGDPSRG
ncbi:MAG TPA: CCA tRNA nucleotidyltransferase [Humisphaera sp.]